MVSEWDFRSVREDELMTALLYEYTRSCTPARQAIRTWHSQPFDLDSLVAFEHLSGNEAQQAARFLKPGITNAQGVDCAYSLDLRNDIPDVADALVTALRLAAPPSLFHNGDRSIPVRFSSLEKPWPELQRDYGDAALKVRLIAIPERSGGILWDLGLPHTYEHLFDLEPGLRKEELLIDWSLPMGDLMRAFRILAKNKQEDSPRVGARRPGRAAKWERLKWLAAYRLRQAGYNYSRAKEIMDKQLAHAGGDDLYDVLPTYHSDASWGKMLSRARKELSGDFARMIKSVFQSP